MSTTDGRETQRVDEFHGGTTAALPPVRSEPLLADDDHLAYFLADGVLSTLEVSGRTVAARMILQAIDQYKANAQGQP